MATGGVTGEEELYSFELFECSVCLESLINKQPRLLSCGHTFCTPCLQKLSGRKMVNCPKCRSTTQLPPGGVQALPKNTDISKMREREQELSARNEHFCQMCRKRDAKIEYICTSCSKRLICQECYKKHQRIPAFKAHNILPIEETLSVNETHEKCKDHGDLLEYFCPQCEEAICAACTCDPEHEEHCEQIVDFKTGLKELKASMNKLCQEFKQNAKKVEVCVEILKQDTDSIKKCKDTLFAKCQEVETVLNQMKEQLKVVTELYQPLRNSREEIYTHFANVQKQITEINNLQQGSDMDFIRKIKECRRNCDGIMNDTQMILNRKITIPEIITHNIKLVGNVGHLKTIEVSLKEKVTTKTQSDVTPREQPQTKPVKQQVLRPRPRQTDKNNELKNLELLLEIKPGGTVHVRNPLEVVSVGDGTVILVDKELNYLQMINTEGNVVRRYQVTLSQQAHYKSASVYGDCLFVLTSDNVITKMSLDGSGCNTEYKPEGVRTIDYISAIGDNVILISEGGFPYRIIEYNTETNQIILRVKKLSLPGKVSVVQAGHVGKYVVKYYKYLSDKFIPVVNIYNKDWNLISIIDNNPDVLTVTPGGKLLNVHNNRIHEYSQDGRLIRRLLDEYKFNEIQDITYSGGCLWVLEKNPDVTSDIIKIFHSVLYSTILL